MLDAAERSGRGPVLPVFRGAYNPNRRRTNTMSAIKVCLCTLFSAVLLFTVGCGSKTMAPNCGPVGLNVGPASATVDHAAAAPGNTQTFSASFQFSGSPGCVAAQTAALVNSNWAISDPSVHLSATQGGQVVATCTAALASPVTVTATPASGQMFTGRSTLTCN